MALGKYSRVDGRKSSSSYCSTVTIVAFVALCLVGVWMMTSSSVVPGLNTEVSTQEKKTDLNDQVFDTKQTTSSSENSDENAKQFEDNSGDLPNDGSKNDDNSNQSQEEKNDSEDKTSQTSTEDNQEEKNVKESAGDESKSEDNQVDKTIKESAGDESKSEDNQVEKTIKESAGDESKSEDTSKTDSESQEGKEDVDLNLEKKDNIDSTLNKDSEVGETKTEDENENKPNSNETENKSDNSDEVKDQDNVGENKEEKVKEEEDTKTKEQSSAEVFPSGAQSELLNETTAQNGAFSTQVAESKNEKESQKSSESDGQTGYNWKLCNVTAGPDFIPCLDNLQAIRSLRSTKHYEHRERHCPEDPPTCLVPLPEGYQKSIEWPTSREKIWYHNVPHTKLAEIKGHQNWVKVSGDYLTFPGGGTQFKHGALHYIDFIQQSVPDIAWGKKTRVVLDVGCGVASFGGYLFDRDVLTMSLAPKDEHEAQVQFALERGIPAISAVMGTKRLPFPGRTFDVVHCARCRVPWHIEGGKLLLELNRLLRPGGYFVWSATPVYQKLAEDVEIWEAMKTLTKGLCWEVVSITKDRVNGVGIAIYQKPMTNECYVQRSQGEPPLCQESDDPNAAWNVPLQACIHKVPVEATERGSQWPEQWPERLTKAPYWLLGSQIGVYGKPAPEDFTTDYEHWKRVVNKSYLGGMGIDWSSVRNAMDMKAIYGGFAATLKEMNRWVLNVVPIDSPDTLPIIYERGLFGIYHDWCESLSAYPRSYDLLHADHLFSKIKKKCNFMGLVAETDRILRPEGKLIVRDHVDIISELESLFRAMQWEIRLTYSNDNEGLLCVQKTMWRPNETETISYAIA